jgi:hypothetical protein
MTTVEITPQACQGGQGCTGLPLLSPEIFKEVRDDLAGDYLIGRRGQG